MRVADVLPIARWLPDYDRTWFRSDLIAGLTVWALVVPQAIAYAQIAGLPPQAGVFASFAAPLGYALFGTSRQMICSPTSATAAISAALVAPAVVDNPEDFAAMAAALAILCGIMFFILGLFKMGFISQFIATAAQAGFMIGLGLTIIVGQLFKVFGFPGIDGPFYKQAWEFVTNLDQTSGWTLAVGAASLVALFALSRSMPKLPAALILVALSIVFVTVGNLDNKGVEIVGQVDRAVPTPAIPNVSLEKLLTLVAGTLAIVVVGYSESISVARRFAEEHRYDIDPNQELTALGVSSAFGGLFQGFITAGGASQSAANDRAGAKSQVASLVLAGLAFLTAIALLPLFKNLPQAVLGAIVINAVAGFVNLDSLRRLAHLRKDSFALALIALFGVLILGILPGLLIAVALSVILMLTRLGRPDTSQVAPIPGTSAIASIENHEDAVPRPGLAIFRPDAPLLFANATWIRDDLKSQLNEMPVYPDVVVLDLEGSKELDVTSLDILQQSHRELAEKGTELWLSDVRSPVRTMLDRSGFSDTIGEDRIFLSTQDAVAAFDRRETNE